MGGGAARASDQGGAAAGASEGCEKWERAERREGSRLQGLPLARIWAWGSAWGRGSSRKTRL